MYKHHEESLENLKQYFSDREEVIALIFGGSVAKGCERPDSDLDAMVGCHGRGVCASCAAQQDSGNH